MQSLYIIDIAAALTVHGIETFYKLQLDCPLLKVLRQHLLFTVCAEGCKTAEEQCDDEVRTSQVPERREGKMKMMRK